MKVDEVGLRLITGSVPGKLIDFLNQFPGALMSYLVPLTGEIQVNTTTLHQQDDPRIAALPDGGFVVVWESLNAAQTRNDVFQQIYNAAGQPVGGNVQLNTATTYTYYNPRVEVLNDGSWVVAWGVYNSAAGVIELYGRKIGADGVPAGAEFQINTLAAGEQYEVEMTALDDGGFLAVWYSESSDGDGYGIRAQRFDGNGQLVGAEYTVNTVTGGDQLFPKATTLDNGNVLISWQSYVYDTMGARIGSQSFGQIIQPDGTKSGAQFELLTTEVYNGAWSIDALNDGGFVVTGWSQVNGEKKVVVQVHDATGQAVTSPDYIELSGTPIYEPSVTAASDGGFIVSYTVDVAGTGTTWGHEYTFIQRYDADGLKVGSPVQVNTHVGSRVYQDDADLITLEDGRIVVTWEGYAQDGSEEGVFLRIFESQMVGTQGRDKLAGTNADDIISGRGGNDLLNGRGGDDLIRGGDGNDVLRGSGGKDRLEGEDGSDNLQGGNARDFLIGGKGRDVLDGGKGNDVLNGGAGADQFIFSAGRDKITKFENNRDEVVLDRAALGLNGKDAQDVLDDYGSIISGNAVLDFGGGDILTVRGVTDLSVLADDIAFI
jgi:Ca2+-binding RTX toxin-like protein